MKISFQIEVDDNSKKIFFPEERIKTKLKLIEILLEACRYIIYSEKKNFSDSNCKMILHNEKMSRLFFIERSKMYSIVFPFNIYIDRDQIKLSYRNLLDVDSYIISNLLGCIKDPAIESDSCLDFIDPIVSIEEDSKINHWTLLRELILLEDGYIRYDEDEKGYKEALSKDQEHRHPLHHLDIFYSNKATFKLGLEKNFIDTELVDALNTNTNCRYLKNLSP